MAMVRARGAKFELRIKHRLLPKPYTATFDTEGEARDYGNQLEAMLAQGIIPREAVARPNRPGTLTVGRLIREYLDAVVVSALDRDLLDVLTTMIGAKSLDTVLQYKWVEDWIRSLKVERNLAPGSIRKRVGALARMIDWHLKREAEDGRQPLANPLRLLPKNYSTYNERERKLLAGDKKKVVKTDIERDRRLHDGEEARILAAMMGQKREDRERALLMPERDAMIDLFQLIVNTGLRLREAYRLRVQDVRLDLRTIHVALSKTGAARDVPIVPDLYAMLERRRKAAQVQGADTLIFPWWDGLDVYRLLQELRHDVRDWGVSMKTGEPIDPVTNSFRNSQRGFEDPGGQPSVVCLWFQDIDRGGDPVCYDGNDRKYRNDLLKAAEFARENLKENTGRLKAWSWRSTRLEGVVSTAFYKRQPLRVSG